MGIRKITLDAESAESVTPGIRRQHLSTGRVTIARYELEAGTVTALHSHPHEQTSYVLEGDLVMEVDGEDYRLESGDLITIPPNTDHRARVREDTLDLDVFAPPRDDWAAGRDPLRD